jgi:putative Holliday junction resolvase
VSAGTLLCFDYGHKRIGVAVGQQVTGTASALEIVLVRHGRPDWDRIGALMREWGPGAVIVGTPLNMDGTRQPATDAADRFARRLAGRFGIRVHRVDERLTTFVARKAIAPGERADAEAARIMLESWMSESGPASGATPVAPKSPANS